MLIGNARRTALTVALAIFVSGTAEAQSTTQTASFAISAINQIAFSGSPSLTISAAFAGAAPSSVTNATATWAVTTNQSGAKITASIPSGTPPGLTLSASLAPPLGATSAGFQPLGTVAADLVTGITKVAQASMLVTYSLDATAAAGVIPSTSRVVTYTITGGT